MEALEEKQLILSRQSNDFVLEGTSGGDVDEEVPPAPLEDAIPDNPENAAARDFLKVSCTYLSIFSFNFFYWGLCSP